MAKANGKIPNKSITYQVMINDIDSYEHVKEYLTHYQTTLWFVSYKEINPETKDEYIRIYVEYTGPIKLRVKNIPGTIVYYSRKVPLKNIGYVLNRDNVLDIIGIDPTNYKDNDIISLDSLLRHETRIDVPKVEPIVKPKKPKAKHSLVLSHPIVINNEYDTNIEERINNLEAEVKELKTLFRWMVQV